MEWGWPAGGETKPNLATASGNIATGNSNIPDAWGGGTAPAPGAAATAAPAAAATTPGKYKYAALNPLTGEYQLYDPVAKKWSDPVKSGDVFSQLDEEGQAAHPDWYYGQESDLNNQQRQYDQDRQTNSYARFAGMGTTTGYKFPDYGID